jgi:hypothetical protein
MPGCCLGALVLFFGPRLTLFLIWLFTSWYAAFESRTVALLGFLLVPWTSLAWMFVFFRHHGDLSGGYLLVLIAAAVVDLGSYGSSHAARTRVGYKFEHRDRDW